MNEIRWVMLVERGHEQTYLALQVDANENGVEERQWISCLADLVL